MKEIVIKLPEKMYDEIRRFNGHSEVPINNVDLYTAIQNGTVLPKGHGDLVDLGKLIDNYWDGNSMEIHESDLPDISKALEADHERIRREHDKDEENSFPFFLERVSGKNEEDFDKE